MIEDDGLEELEEVGPDEIDTNNLETLDFIETNSSAVFGETVCISVSWLARQEKNPAPMVLLDASFLIQWRNDAFRNFRETAGLEYRGRPFPAMFTTFADSKTREQLLDSLRDEENGFGWQGLVSGRGNDGRIFKANLTVYPLEYNDSDKPLWFLATLYDVTEQNRKAVRRTFDSILKASLLKDEGTGNHIKRVNSYSGKIAENLKGDPRWLEVDDDYIADMSLLAAFHDVGKIGTPDAILQKVGPLDDKEWAVMKDHPINGAMILDSHPNGMAKEIARSHHERWDGSGYPFGLVGPDIPLAARIVAIADVYDALRTKRSYKEAFSEEETVDIIQNDAGTHFDPELVTVFLSLREDFNRIFNDLGDD